jgi:flagellar hook protein FlgE
MFSAVSGLRVHQTRMDVIAHNVSNVNTVGFKSSRTLFEDVFSQTIAAASGPSEATGRGGVNAMQIGLGANVSAIDRMMTPGAMQRTDYAFDLMIQGAGFFIVADASGQYFTRAGAMRLDRENNLTIPNGMTVMGWRVGDPGPDDFDPITGRWRYPVHRGAVQPIQLSQRDMFAPPRPTSLVSFNGNLDGSPDADPVYMTMTIRDSLGNRHIFDVRMEMIDRTNGTTEWGVEIRVGPPNQIALQGASVDADGVARFEIQFDEFGRLATVGGVEADEIDIILDPGDIVPAATTVDPLRMSFGGLTQYGNVRTTARVDDTDGLPAGELSNLSVGQDGMLMALYTNGYQRALWQIPVAEFRNPPGLEAIGGNLFRPTANSGEFDGVGLDGVMQGGVLEMSNVDLGAEFTDMIITQRGFQANSRLITTSDDMLQELVNLRR